MGYSGTIIFYDLKFLGQTFIQRRRHDSPKGLYPITSIYGVTMQEATT